MTSLNNQISEKELGQFLHELGQVWSWSMYHQVDTGACPNCHRPSYSKRVGPGFPDWVMAHENGRLLAIELKSQKGSIRPEQVAWLQTLARGPAEVYLFRPSDMDTITRILEPSYTAPTGETLVLPAKYRTTETDAPVDTP